jgi:protein-arginine deiminase
MKTAALAAALITVAAVPAVAAPVRLVLAGDSIFLPNLDDDSHRCHVDPADMDRPGLDTDRKLAACNDAADDVVNGPEDEKDLAHLYVRANRDAQVTADDHVRVFVRRNGTYQVADRLTASELRHGVDLAVEGKDVVRDPSKWDGRATVKVTTPDSVATKTMRVAPMLLQNDLQPATTVFAAEPPAKPTPLPPIPQAWAPSGWGSFDAGLRAAGAPMRYVTGTDGFWWDQWWQDLFEPATVSMPTRHGVQEMRILIRSASLWEIDGQQTLRPTSRLLFRDLRGPGVGVVQEFTPESRSWGLDLRNSTGNIESVPPYAGYPQGRVVYGTAFDNERKPDPAFIRMITSQGAQPAIAVDTSWLAVGHADETMHVVRANNARGWTLMVADPRLAAKIRPLTDPKLADQNETAAKHIDDQMKIMLAETGLRPDELVRVPVQFKLLHDYPLFVAETTGIPNGISLNDRSFAAPDPKVPEFRKATEQALTKQGVRVHWVDDMEWAHNGGGEVHCTTNAFRDTSGSRPWWI